ncbi:MAG: UDP-glucose--hexose-1-phosphate uridylyltransferase [Desulfotalea sp.]
MSTKPHKRYNPLNDEWVLVSPHRAKRPWQGQNETTDTNVDKSYDDKCYLCPTNTRVTGDINPDYKNTFVFDNDFPALLPDSDIQKTAHSLLRSEPETGCSKVICYSPNHHLSIARLKIAEIQPVVKTWVDEYQNLGCKDDIDHVQIFENRGAVMGCSNPHPHGQIWATSSIPSLVEKELKNQQKYKAENNSCLLCDYLKVELSEDKRIVYENNHFIALIPYWATWPYELMVLPKRHIQAVNNLSLDEQYSLADILKIVGIIYDNLFSTSFPYSMGLHQRPTDGGEWEEHHLHIHYYPPLLRSATIKKFMVGFEMMAMPQRDLTPEGAADILNALPRKHYLED